MIYVIGTVQGRVADPDLVEPDPDPTLKKKTGFRSDHLKRPGSVPRNTPGAATLVQGIFITGVMSFFALTLQEKGPIVKQFDNISYICMDFFIRYSGDDILSNKKRWSI